MALVAEREQVLRMVLGESAWIATIGVAAGINSTLALARLIAGVLYGLNAYNPMTFGASAVMLILIGLAASGIPARRKSGRDASAAARVAGEPHHALMR